MNKQERATHFINGMFGEENVRMVIPDCVQNDCCMRGEVDGKIVVYNVRKCSRDLFFVAAECLYRKYDVSCSPRFDPYTNSGTIKVLISEK